MKSSAKKYYILLTGLVFIFIFALVMYSLGYRIKSDFTLGKIGYLDVTLSLPNTSIFIDQSKKIVTGKENEALKVALSPNNHSIIISHESYFPWKKDFEMPSAGTVILSPMFVSQNPSGEIIAENDPEYRKIKNIISSDKLPTKDSPRLSEDKIVSVWVEEGAILAKTGEDVQTVITPDTTIRNLYFYKNRSDTLIFSTENSIFAIEIDKNGGQNFMPIYKGQEPVFVGSNPNFIYVFDGGPLMQVNI